MWDVEEKTQVAEFHGHKFGVNCVVSKSTLSEGLFMVTEFRCVNCGVSMIGTWRAGCDQINAVIPSD